MNRFGIAVDNKNFIIDMKYFEPDEFNSKYYEITETQYLNWIKIRQPWSKFIGGELVNNAEDQAAYFAIKNIENLRKQLEDLSIKIDLAERMLEDTKDLLAEFERVKVVYNNLTNNNQ